VFIIEKKEAMKMMMRLFPALLIALMLWGCGGKDVTSSGNASTTTGWAYNDPDNGGFEVMTASEQETGPGLILVEGGTFTMGNEKGNEDEEPAHAVYSDAFYIDSAEVNCERYERFLEDTGYPPHQMWNPELDRPEDPVVGVTWHDASAFAKWAGKRLPTEAEWEKAARGGLIDKKYPLGDEIDREKANYKSFGITTVKSYGANGFGLYDMAGNVWEWCHDWYSQEYYRVSANKNPKGPMLGSKKVVRGGAWYCNEDALHVFNRHKNDPTMGSFHIGFRCAKSANDVVN